MMCVARNLVPYLLLAAQQAPGLELVGHAEFQGTQATLLWQIAADGRFRREIRGPLTRISGFDGNVCWQMDEAGVAYELRLFAREYALGENALVAGTWCEPDGGFECTPAADGTLEFGPKDGRLRGFVELEPEHQLPRAWRLTELGEDAGLAFADWQPAEGRWIPRDIVTSTSSGLRGHYTIDAVHELGAADFARPPRAPNAARFDPELPPGVALRRTSSGHLFVRPRLEGHDVGWFVFDTGAALSVIDPAVAQRLGMSAIGNSTLVGAGAEAHQVRLRASGKLELGPLTIEHMVWSELPRGNSLEELRGLVDGEPLGGILGFEVLIRCVAELDLNAGRLALHDPTHYVLPEDGRWEPMILHRKHPCVRGSYPGGHAGWFGIDSGAGAMSLCFHAPTVLAEGLLDGLETTEVEAAGAGGVFRLPAGELEWFEVAGRRIAHPTVFFSRETSGAFADAWTAGTLGHPFFEGLNLVFDYAGGRIGILPGR